MTLNERIKELRKSLDLSQKEFAETIGISQRSVSWGEQPGNNVPDNTIKNICMSFGINEEWLRTGKKPMYIHEPTFSLDKFVKDHGGTNLELEAMKAYFELDPNIRKILVNHFKERLNFIHDEPAEPTINTEEQKKQFIAQEADEFAELAREQFISEKNQESKTSSVKKYDAKIG